MTFVLIMSFAVSALLYINPQISFAQEKKNIKLYYIIRADEGQPKTHSLIDSNITSGWFIDHKDTKKI